MDVYGLIASELTKPPAPLQYNGRHAGRAMLRERERHTHTHTHV